ncbi:MAG: response regulator transcription factor [bacterium]|nr:DNA-binding response regulator [Deltaproteobacteria bacterium]MCP4903861.1 response regulator transcription factor [bacterium]
MERQHEESSQLPVLVIEDEEAILRGLCDVLAFQGYAPSSAGRGDLGLELALDPDHEPALVVLDVMLPGLSGFDVCERLRGKKPALPILMLTARGSEEDILRGFRCGADDYVTKPFSVSELVARVEALLRRSGAGLDSATASDGDRAAREPSGDPAPFDFGHWQIVPSERAAQCAGEVLELTSRDLELLAFFVRERGRILSRRRLLSEVWDYPDPERIETRSVDMHIAKLRKKLGPRDGALIETIRGEGYRFRG